MIKVKKFLPSLIVFLLILSNIAFAQFSADSAGFTNKQMMERFQRGEISEDEMYAMAKERLGTKFTEEEFQKNMMELKERMNRKDAFSYENKGFQHRYDMSPSYEGYSKEQRLLGMVFEHIGDDMDPREIKKYCNDPNKIADIIIDKLKEKVGDLQKLCTRFEEQEAKCLEHLKKACSQLGTAMVREDATEMEKIQSVAYSCPVNNDAIKEACKRRAKNQIEQQIHNSKESCEKRFEFQGERLTKECEMFRQNQICDKDKFMERCMGGIKKEDFERKPICPVYPVPQCDKGSTLKSKVDSNGCVYYYCETITTTNVCSQDVQQCPDGTYVKRAPPSCNFEACPTTTKCPEPVTLTCAERQTLQKKTDDRGCVYYYCTTASCPTVQKPTCNTDETLQTYYDNAGCVTSYQCIKQQTACPTVTKPTCSEGQSLTTKHDDKGCVVGYGCVSVTTTTTANAIKITGNAVLSTYDDFLKNCENSWLQQQKICVSIPNTCDKDTFIEKCTEQGKKNYEDYASKIEYNCETQTASQIKAAEDRCSRIGEERKYCLEQSTKRCEQMKGIAQQCKETLTEEKLRNFIIEEAKKRCKFVDIVQDEGQISKAEKVEIILAVLNTATKDDIEKLELFVDNLHEELKLQDTTVYKGIITPNNFNDIKLLSFVVNAKISTAISSEKAKEVKAKIVARQNFEEAASKLVSLRDSDVPNEYLYIIEDKASDVLNVSDNLKKIEKKEEEKGVGYKIRLFLGLAKKAEQEEIGQLDESKQKLNNSIEALTKLIDEVPSDVAKVVLKEQVENLKKQQADIDALIKSKEKKAKGLFGVFE